MIPPSMTPVSLFVVGTKIISPLIRAPALIDIVRNEIRGENEQVTWVLMVTLTGIIGAMIYFIFGRRQKIYQKKYATANE